MADKETEEWAEKSRRIEVERIFGDSWMGRACLDGSCDTDGASGDFVRGVS